MRKSETNKERAAREDEGRITLVVARNIVRLIQKSSKNRVALHDVKRTKESPAESKEQTDAFVRVGATICGTPGSISEFLRMVDDLLEGKEPYTPGDDWYDKPIRAAYYEAFRRHGPDVPPRVEGH